MSGEVAPPLDYHPLLSQSHSFQSDKKLTTLHQDDDSYCDLLGCICWCLTVLWSVLKRIGSVLWYHEDQSNEAKSITKKNADCEKTLKGGEGTTKISTLRKLYYWCLLWEIPRPRVEPLPRRNVGSHKVKILNQTKELHQMLELPHHYTLQSTTDRVLPIEVKHHGPITEELYNLFKLLNSSNYGSIDTGGLLSMINERDNMGRFSGRSQQDSHELLRCLLPLLKQEEIECIKTEIKDHNPPLDSYLESEYLKMVNKISTTLDQKFGGICINTVICRECYEVQQLQEPFFDISQSIPNQVTQVIENEVRWPTPASISSLSINDDDDSGADRQEVVTSPFHVSVTPKLHTEIDFQQEEIVSKYVPLQKHLCSLKLQYHPVRDTRSVNRSDLEKSLNNEYMEVDVLDDDNLFICDYCNNDNSRVSKQALIMKLNSVLILHIKRFNLGDSVVTKNNSILSFTELLDMAPYCTKGCLDELQDKKGRILYGLYAVVVHSGTTLKSGHYIAYVKSRPNRLTDPSLLNLRSTQFKYDRKSIDAGKWYFTSDERITECYNGFDGVKGQQAYMLFYELLPRVRHYQSTTV